MADSITSLDFLPGTILLDNFNGTGDIMGRLPEVLVDGAGNTPWGLSSTGANSIGTVSGGITSIGARAYGKFNGYTDETIKTRLYGPRLDACLKMTGLPSMGNSLTFYVRAHSRFPEAGVALTEQIDVSLMKNSNTLYSIYVNHRVFETVGGTVVRGGSTQFSLGRAVIGGEDMWIGVNAPRNSTTKEVFWNGEKWGEYELDTSDVGWHIDYFTAEGSAFGNDYCRFHAVRLMHSPIPGPPDPFWTSYVKTREQLE